MMSTLMDIEFVHALNPLYAFPIVAVILCAFIVYAFGFKSPVQPPSFDAIDEEKKSTKKRKVKEINKVKVIQNGKLNGSSLNKNQVSVSAKKKEIEKSFSADKSSTEKSLAEKKVTKKSKSSNEKKVSREKKKDSSSQEDAGEGGWVQLISKKERKNRKKDEAINIERQTCIVKPVQYPLTKSDEIIQSEETPKADDVIENSVSDKKLALKDEENENVPVVESCMEKVVMEDCKTVDVSIEKAACEENVIKNGKILDETTIKSKKKKKRNPEVNANSNETNPELPAEQVISEVSNLNSITNNSSVTIDTSVILVGNVEKHSKETKTSNVVFDELAGLYPEQKEQKKKKRVRRDH